MDINDVQNEESIPEGAILMTANNILNLLEYSEQLKNEEDLFSDEFYISILSNILSDQKFDIKPGETLEEKVKSLNQLIKLLSEVIEIDLSQISAEGIIMEHDKVSAKSFLDLIEELIKTLINANGEEEENELENDTKNETKKEDIKNEKEEVKIKNESNDEINEDNLIKPNNSEGNIFGGNKNKLNLDDNENEFENEEYFNINRKGLDKDEEINIEEFKKDQESIEKNMTKSDKKSENINNDDQIMNNNNTSNEEMKKSFESFKRLNQSNIEQLELEKMFKNLENKNEDSYIRKTYSQNDLSAYERQLAEREDENENENEEGNIGENEQSPKKSKNDVKFKKDILSSPEDGENKFPEGVLDLNYNLEDKNLSGEPIMNVSHISELSQDKSRKENEMKKSSGKKDNKSEKKNKKDSYEDNEENIDLNKSIKNIETPSDKSEKNIENSSKNKLEDELPDLFIKQNQKNKNSNKFEYDEEEDKKNLDSNEDESNLEGDADEYENIYIPNSVPRAYNKLHLPSASKDSESSRQSKNKRVLDKESNSSLTNSNISFHSKNSKKSSDNKNIVDYNDLSKSSTNKKNSNINSNKKNLTKKKENKISTNKKEQSFTDNKSQRSQKMEREIEDNENEESASNISKSSVYTNDQEKSIKSSASKKNEISKKNKSITNSEKNKELTSTQKQTKSNKKYNIKEILNVEIPMTDKEIKYEIMKEIKRLYGEKSKKYFNKSFLEVIIENIKLARKAILKMETGVEPDDNFSKEFILKYKKEIQKILKYYIEEKNKENNYKKNAIMSLGQNIKFVKMLKEAELKDILNIIENKKKEKELRNEEEQNQIMLYPSYCYELQKQIYIAQTQNQIDLNNAIIEEKKKMIEESEKAYNDRIAIMHEILKRERRERINQKKLNESLEYELKKMNKRKLKMQVEDMLNQIDEEDRKMNEGDANNQEEIEKILRNFY